VANEAFAHGEIDQFLKDAVSRLTDGRSVDFKYSLDSDRKAVSALFDCRGRALAMLEAARTRVHLSAAEAQGLRDAGQFDVPFTLLFASEEARSYGGPDGRHPALTARGIHRRRHRGDARVNSTSLHTEGRHGAVGRALRSRHANA